MLLADAPILTLDVQSASIIGGSLLTGLVSAAKIVVNYLKEKDNRHDNILKDRETFFTDERKRRDEDQKFIAAKFADTITRLEEKQDKSTEILLNIQKETVIALGELTKSIHSHLNYAKTNSEKVNTNNKDK